MGLLMQTTMLVAQNSVEMRDLGAASGAATLFRTVGGSLGVSLLGVFYNNQLQGTLADQLGAAAGSQVAGGQITPSMLAELPVAVRTAFTAAVDNGVTTAFLAAGLVAILAIGAALLVREVPLRGSTPAPEREPVMAG
jgi:hypothetical protein